MQDDETTGLDIAAYGLRKYFDGSLVRAVDGVDLEIGAGEQVAITGPTGCGKSTLLSMLGLLERPDGGELILGGQPAASIASPERWRADNLGIVFQFHHLLPHLTVAENVMLPLIGRRTPRAESRERSRSVLQEIGLAHRADALASTLSGGERQLAAVARALVDRPRLILADEPTGSVDSRTGARVLELLLAGELSAGATVVLVTHDPAVAAHTGRHISMLDGKARALRGAPSPPAPEPGDSGETARL